MKILIRVAMFIVIGAMFFSIMGRMQPGYEKNYTILYSDFIQDIRNGAVAEVTITGETVKGKRTNGERFVTYNPDDGHMIDDLIEYGVKIKVATPEKQSMLMQIFISWAPMLLLIAVWVYFYRKQQGAGGGGQMGMGKSRAKLLEEDEVKVGFSDVAGVEEAKEDVMEMVDFLKDPSKYEFVGGKIPHGVLLVGPPGTGKTLLARAIAGEAKVPFFSISGSDFVEMFVGVGASRVRDMFEQAKKRAPCIIFIDEIDAVGRQRGGSGPGGGNDEREQTLNQLLVEMDGFSGNEGIIVIAATNRSDVLDKALLRPGRFDREVHVGLPDIKGREQILKVHSKKIPLAEDVNIKDLARGTPGFSGAELANLINEGALLAARNNKRIVNMDDLDRARDKLLMGAEKRSMVMRKEDLLMTAYHEAGHAIVGQNVPEHDPVYKVSIMPRGGALGITMFLPERDQYSASKDKLESQISGLFGGRIAEAIIYGKNKVTTGASNDIERATQLARNMVTKWGLSDKLGPMDYGDSEGYMGSQAKPMSEEMAKVIDDEIRVVIDKNYQRAEDILNNNIDILHNMAHALMDWETIDKFQIEKLLNGEKLDPPVDEPEEDEVTESVDVELDTETETVEDDTQSAGSAGAGHQEM
ncbi:cell division protease FtsH [Bathymodiolus platifrons methanotrophic gill symbiont]|uniref:ATP-dependent zinc metalloprotease FtsH n=1 Tax=Bathymodiolus platifrons methanotrophic gill symbiont TaxID=113268 RepID=UPI000B409C9C|nr:ATP-dependent zinc metalloprotease FtsH [Methyloprofundus sp.]TXK96496.1 cell division protein FtsH [Methylococcaceae bacterium CS5]TXK99442.1 cell division protein FtsH [Methylococcaceae bacterium CS4]TXL05354.1 cell division protein FtsH [Methylococcaceae bacterium CS1]TXL05454.1 cell division protein FtsH [Methylococcaceae bacterium CS3]TXL10132.1 cell division protein FtsH [Methylococcaceae bacterium CS2]GAW85703.1 cell division protease FtsH [Bathymodiolus platifrons methanotrophic gi